jgi:hypothetical protein
VVIRLRVDALADEFDGFDHILAIYRYQSEMMQARRVVRNELQHSLVCDFGFRESAIFQMLNGLVVIARGFRILDLLRQPP